jgi:formylglycine-generating enzyme required for sulfatase activity
MSTPRPPPPLARGPVSSAMAAPQRPARGARAGATVGWVVVLSGCFVSKAEVAAWARLAGDDEVTAEDEGGAGALDGVDGDAGAGEGDGGEAADDAGLDGGAADAGGTGDGSGDGGAVATAPWGDGEVALTVAGVEFVVVHGGTFDMGCTPGQSYCDPDESPTRTTTLSHDLYISRAELTQEQLTAVVGHNPSRFVACGGACPVEQVSWHDAAAFANALSITEGLPVCYSCSGSGTALTCTSVTDPDGCGGYRLPTEAEWEGAARCGEDLLYAGADAVDEVAWSTSNAGSSTQPVAALAANACGLYDMSGNVYEWVNDWYDSAAYAGGDLIDPVGPATGVRRVVRGGSWSDLPQAARVAARLDVAPADRADYLGVRLVRTVP